MSALKRVAAWLRKPAVQASALVCIGFFITLAIALIGDAAGSGVLLLLALLSGIFQYLGASKFHDSGRADPTLARASVRRLMALGMRSRAATKLAEAAYEQGSPSDAKRLMGRLSAELSFIEEGAVQAVEDWREFHRDAVSDVVKGESHG